MAQWQALNSQRGKFYKPPVKRFSAADSIVPFPIFNTDPFDTSAPATRYDVATNAATTMWNRALGYAANGRTDDAERLKTQVIRSSTEQVVNALGYSYLNNGYLSLAIDVFQRNAEAHPTSWKAYFSLAEAWGYRGDTLSAIANYNKALSLATDTTTKTNIKNRIANLLR
jgi:Flp pilus assembly protein TadD